MPLGIEDGRLATGALSASSMWNNRHGPDRARLNQRAGHGRTGAWVSRIRNRNQWLQVTLPWLARVNKIWTQGRQDSNQWVTRYRVTYSVLGYRFLPYKQLGRFKVEWDGYTDELLGVLFAVGAFIRPFLHSTNQFADRPINQNESMINQSIYQY